MAGVEISPAALSDWGRMMRQLRDWGWSYGAVSRELGVSKATLHAMTTDPRYEPIYSLGLRFRRFYVRIARAERARSRSVNRTAAKL